MIISISRLIAIYTFLLFTVFTPTKSTFCQEAKHDIKIGKEQSATIAAQMGIYQNDSMTAYVTSVGNRLVEKLDHKLFDYQFFIIPDPAPNAFAIPGGYIYITTGLLPIINTEDELACIMAHEIIHSNNRHGVKQIRKSILPGIIEIPGAILGILNDDLGSVFKAPGELWKAGYSRGFETEADIQGIALATAAGYDPNSLKFVLARMANAIEVYTGQSEEKSYFSDHPYTGDRVSNIEKQTAKLSINTKAPISKQYLYKFNNVIFGNDPRQGIIVENQILVPGVSLAITFPENWEIGIESKKAFSMNKDQSAVIVFEEETEFKTAKEASSAFISSIPKDKRNNMMMDNYKNGKVVVYKESSKQGLTFAHLFWLPYNGKLIKIIGLSTRENIPTIKAVVDNLKPLSERQKESIKTKRVYVTTLKKGQTLSEVAQANKNSLDLPLLEAINEIKLDEPSQENKLVKLVVDYPFFK
ncbi:MAG: M48 family metalloprotease [Salibacteraceae bacterium]